MNFPYFGIRVVFKSRIKRGIAPSVGVGLVEVEDHSPLSVEPCRTRVRVYHFVFAYGSFDCVGVIFSVKVAVDNALPYALCASFQRLLIGSRSAVALIIEIEFYRRSRRRPEPERRLFGRIDCAEFAVIGVFACKSLAVEIRHRNYGFGFEPLHRNGVSHRKVERTCKR